MSLIPRTNSNNNNNPIPFAPFSQEFWDNFFTNSHPFSLLHNPPFSHFLSPYPPPQSTPYSELAVETSGDVKTKLECKEIPEAHLIVAELVGIDKDEVEVVAADGGFVKISAIDGRFSWRLKLPPSAKMNMMSNSMENGILTVVVPKYGDYEMMWGTGRQIDGDGDRNVRVVEITGSDE